MSAETFYRDVAKVALTVATKHGFVLGGGVAWLVNGLVDRPTEDVDLFTDTAGGVAAAAGEVTAALTAAGYRVVREEGLDGGSGHSSPFASARSSACTSGPSPTWPSRTAARRSATGTQPRDMSASSCVRKR